MLNFMRQNANSWVMILLFAIIIFVFAINFGPWAGQAPEGPAYAAIVNNKQISLAEFRTAYTSQLARIKQFRPDYEESQAERDGLKNMVLEQLVSRELLTQLGQDQHLKISAPALAQEIKERVFGDENFEKEEYNRRVHGFFQTTIPQFEELVKKELIAQQMADVLGTSIYVSDQEAKTGFIDKNTKLAVEYIKIDPAYFKSQATVKLEQVTAFADTKKDKIAEYYNSHLSQFQKEKQVQASHILVKFPSAEATADEKAKLKEKANALLERVKKGEDFAKVASTESDDLGSKAKGGDLGFFSAGMMVEEFAKSAFALNINEISDVVETPFGYHIIKTTDKMEEQKQTLAQATNEIAEILIRKEEEDAKAKKAAEDALAQLKAGKPLDKISLPGLVYAKVEGNNPVADETTSFSRSSSYIPKLGKADSFIEHAFKISKANESASQVFESDGKFYAIRLKSREDADMAKFETERESLKESLLLPRKRAFLQQYLADLKSRAKITYNQALIKGQEVEL
jgi:peptidyl-prolyl cis-trans isomerase D